MKQENPYHPKSLSEVMCLRDACRNNVDYEGNLVNNRVSWLVASQSFLLTGYVLLTNAPHQHLVGSSATALPGAPML